MTDLTDPTALAEALRPSILRLGRRLRQETHADGLSATDVILLVHVRKNPGIGVSGLAELEGTTQPTISSHVKRLEAVGLLARLADLDDARRSGLNLTPAAVRRLDALKRKRTDWLAKRLAAMPAGERERLAEAVEALTRLANS